MAVFSKSLAAKSVWNIITGTGLWVQIAVQNYVHPLSILEWIRVPDKKKKNISICWKAVLWAFDLIGNSLVWKFGNGVDLRIGIDPWVDCKWRHHLPILLLDKLHSAGIFHLKDIGCPGLSFISDQGWLSANIIGLSDAQDVLCWNDYVAILKAIHVRLSTNGDTLVWNPFKTGKYTPKEGYVHLLQDKAGLELSWWWKFLWKLKFPLKSKIFCSFLFSGKALTWDVLVKIGFEGPGRCYLCKMEVKTNYDKIPFFINTKYHHRFG